MISIENFTPQKLTIANFGYLVSNSWLIACTVIESVFCLLQCVYMYSGLGGAQYAAPVETGHKGTATHHRDSGGQLPRNNGQVSATIAGSGSTN